MLNFLVYVVGHPCHKRFSYNLGREEVPSPNGEDVKVVEELGGLPRKGSSRVEREGDIQLSLKEMIEEWNRAGAMHSFLKLDSSKILFEDDPPSVIEKEGEKEE
ncbi:unnamed protein product [Ilex paraguariensis]|uniref:Uncharacterized protein n=1 Tax=Ilex paraguariensis TaxID=185542 RepID=A0ABC8THE8_9AQUA